jgi:hypothetical protein
MAKINTKISNLVKTSSALGSVGLLILEKNGAVKNKEAVKQLSDSGYKQAGDYLGLMDCLQNTQPVFYLEKDEKINNLVWEIVREYEGGIVSLMDRAGHSGLKTARFVPKNSPFILALSRAQIEKSPAGIFEYAGPQESI